MIDERLIKDIAQLNKSLNETQLTLSAVAKSNLITAIALGGITIANFIVFLVNSFN